MNIKCNVKRNNKSISSKAKEIDLSFRSNTTLLECKVNCVKIDDERIIISLLPILKKKL